MQLISRILLRCKKKQRRNYDDGGSMEYHYPDFTIIKMHTLDGNRDVYIGNKEMTMHNLITSLSIQKDT